jgi:hypothetical protein
MWIPELFISNSEIAMHRDSAPQTLNCTNGNGCKDNIPCLKQQKDSFVEDIRVCQAVCDDSALRFAILYAAKNGF